MKAVIEVASVYQPKAGKKTGVVKTRDDEIYGCWPEHLDKFKPGNTYEIEYNTREWEGQLFKTISFPKAGAGKISAVKSNSHAAHTSTPTATKSVEMFVMAMCGRFVQGVGMRGGEFPGPHELTNMVRTSKVSFTEGMKDEAAVTKDDFNDDLPDF